MAVRPFELHLELTNLCNADCVFCPYRFQERSIGFMSREIFDKAVDDYISEGGGSVFLTPVVGDALIHRDVLDYVRDLRSHPEIDRIAVTCNCIMVDRFGADAVIQSGITQLIVSITGFDEEMYQRVYRSKQYKRVPRNVLALLDANRRAGDPVNIVERMRQIRQSFGTPTLNATCVKCDMYRDLEIYRTREGRKRASINQRRANGEVIHRDRDRQPFLGG